MPRIMLLAGSMRPNSCSQSACRIAASFAESLGAEAEVVTVRDPNLPMYIPDVELEGFGEAANRIQTLIDAYRMADSYLWCSPAYHGTVTGAFKNALDFAEFLSGDIPPYLQEKAVGMVSINDSSPFPAMRDSARELRAWVAPTHVSIPGSEFDVRRELANERFLNRLRRLVEELLSHQRRS
jgi:FMN reductase